MEQSHNEWVTSIKNGDNRKWIVEEDPMGNPRYYEIDPEEQARLQGGEGPTARINRKARETMAKKGSKEPKPYLWQLGYNHCIGRFANSHTYPTLSGSSLNRKKQIQKKKSKKTNSPVVHIFSPRSRGKVKDKSMAFFRSLGKDKIFLTLTFIQDIPDRLGVQILNKFLTVLRKEKTNLEYLWVAEHQEETRTTIHFHMILNRRLPIKRYNALWVLQQYNSGLIAHRNNGEAITMQEIQQRYDHDMTSRFKRKDPDSMMAILNPFHIEKAYSIQGLAKYLTLYITQQKKKDPFGCLNWHCSRKVSKLFTKEVVSPSTFAYLLSFVNYKLDRDTGECWKPDVYNHKFFTMVYVNNKSLPLARLRQLETVNKWLIQDFEPDKLPIADHEFYRKFICRN